MDKNVRCELLLVILMTSKALGGFDDTKLPY